MRNIEKYEKDYLELPFEKYQVYYRRKKILEEIEKYDHKTILEVGCGMEPLCKFYQDFEQMIIIEPADAFYNNTVNIVKNEKKSGKVKVIHGFFEDKISELKKYEYDYIIISGLLQEVEYPDLFLKQVLLLCSENTVVHINVPNAYSIHRLLAYEAGIITDVHDKSKQQRLMQQTSTFDLDSLFQLAEQTGFEVIEKGSYFPKFFTHAQMQTLMEQQIIDEKILDGMYRMGKYLPEYGTEIYVQLRKNK